MRKSYLLTLSFVFAVVFAHAQRVGINNDGSAPDSSAMLDVKNPTKGLLIPRVALTGTDDAATVHAPATSLMVYNTTSTTGSNSVAPGFYYYNGARWSRISDDGSGAVYAIGQSLYGGTIFWLDSTKKHGLIAAVSDTGGSVKWYNGSYINTKAVRAGIYGGAFNTNHINDVQGTGIYASILAAQYDAGNFGDWYLPSKDELNLMYQMKTVIGSLSGVYWSSTEVTVDPTTTSDFAWSQDFGSGTQDNTQTKNSLHNVRAIRQF